MKLSRKSIIIASVFASIFVSSSWAGLTSLTQISSDTSTNPGVDYTVQHKTEVDPSQFAFGNTIVTTFQDGEIADWNGAAQVGWATSLDAGKTWHHGYIPGTDSYYWVQVVTYDLKHNTWLIIMVAEYMNTAGYNTTYLNPITMQVSRSSDGLNWSKPIQVYTLPDVNGWVNRPWVACDNNIFSPHFGACYIAWNDINFDANTSTNDLSYSSDGGKSWSAPTISPDQGAGSIGGIAIQPNGKLFLIGCYGGTTTPELYAIESSDGGKTLLPTVFISDEQLVGAPLRTDPFPSATVALDGTIYVVTYDCRFRANCSTNDIVITSSKDGINWTPFSRIPIDSVTSTANHFLAGIASPKLLDVFYGASPTELAVDYYYVTNYNCDPTSPSAATGCQLYAGFISSKDSGKTWSRPTQVFGPMNVLNLAVTAFGNFVANDITAIYVQGQPQGVYSLALPPDPKTGELNQSIYSAKFNQGGWGF